MADVVLIYPPVRFGRGAGRFGLPPLGVLYLAAYLNKHGVEAVALDTTFDGMDLDAIVSRVCVHAPQLVGISGLTPHFQSVKALAAALRGALPPTAKLCLGGPHFNATCAEAFDYVDADFIAVGEGEETLLELWGRLDSGEFSGIPGLAFRQDGKVTVNPPRPHNTDLDGLPLPDLRHLRTRTDYRVRHGVHARATSLMASRGCPFQCAFCDVHTTQGRKLRLRSPQSIVGELRFNVETFGIREFVFKDSTFTVNRRWVSELLDGIMGEKLPISWSINTRVDMIDEGLIRRLKAAGCRRISFGVESGNDKILGNICKGITLAQVRCAFEIMDRSGIESHAFFMIGNPGETRQTAAETIAFAKALRPTFADFSATVAYPGTQIFVEGLRDGLLANKSWYVDDEIEIFLTNTHSVSKGQLNLPDLPPLAQVQAVKRAYRAFYLRPGWILGLLVRNMSPSRLRNLVDNIVPFLRLLFELLDRRKRGAGNGHS